MPVRTLSGDEAMAFGALVSGVKVVASYPGSPSSGTVEVLIGLAEQHRLHVEWSSNEKVAAEVAIGASIAGRRALVATKSVGMNVMVDPLMALNLTPVHGGLVILLGDDPGGYGSQNDQDTRPLIPLLEMPLLEPATPAEGFAMMREAFAASERHHTAIVVRETRSFTKQAEPVEVDEGPYPQLDLGLARDPWRFVPVPPNVVSKHRALHERLDALKAWANRSPFNRTSGAGDRGIVAAGFAYRKLLDALGGSPPQGLRLLKLGVLFPTPDEVMARFLAGCREVLVLEENEPFVEERLKAVAYDARVSPPILGKQSGHVTRQGELFRWQIQRALRRFLPGFTPARSYEEADEEAERPERENHCAGCRFGAILDALVEACDPLVRRPVLVGDPGCLATVADRLDAKFAIGSAVGVACGMAQAGLAERVVALFGDSSFFHTALPAICSAVYTRGDVLMVVLDNGSTVTSGFQPNPGVGRDALGRPAPALSIERIARACGVEWVRSVGPADPPGALRDAFREGLSRRGPALLVVHTPCDQPQSRV
jgi:indolepyruvate ferredoxin oxidoreductase alpha subunit